jgi:ketosteroid isomerase-like protein
MRVLSGKMKISFSAAGSIPFLVALAGFSTEASAAGGNAASLAAAETAFAQESLAKGARTAFLNALSDDAIAFEPGPQNGKKAWRAKKELDGTLQWQPILAAVSTSGDLGYTTGPWSFTSKGEKQPATHGQFISIWRWEGGKWKMYLDLGSHNPAPTAPPDELRLIDNHAPHEARTIALPVMLAQDKAYAANRAANLSGAAEEDVRLYLPNEFPVTERAAAAAALARAPGAIEFGPTRGEVSEGGDLGFVWGEYRDGAGTEPTGYYLRIWRKNRAGEWKLALDLLHPR